MQKDVTEIIVSIMGLLILKKQERVLNAQKNIKDSQENNEIGFRELTKQELSKLSRME